MNNLKYKNSNYQHNYYLKNKDKIRIRHKKYWETYKEELADKARKKYIKNIDKWRKWRDTNREKINANRKKKYRKDKKERPWLGTYYSAKQRCENKKSKDYKYYGGRGIKFFMTVEDFKFLWFRDKAYLLKQPSIDREENDGNYELSNCRYIEHSFNTMKRNKKNGK